GGRAGGGVLDRHRAVLRLLPGAQGIAAGSDRSTPPAVGRGHVPDGLSRESKSTSGRSPDLRQCGAWLQPAIAYSVAMDTKNTNPIALVIHGGAGVIERDRLGADDERAIHADLDAALDAGHAVLAGGGSALDAVEAAARALEDSPRFNAGHGAVFDAEGRHELDASVMEGHTRRAGAIAGVTT